MSGTLGDSGLVLGVLDPANIYVPNAFTVTMGPQQMGVFSGAFECYHIAIQGPAGSSFQIYIGDRFYDFVARGDINSWDPSQTMKLVAGNTVKFYWNVSTGTPTPGVTMYFQEAALL